MKTQAKAGPDAFDPNAPVRLNKYLSDAGYCSRRQADVLIEEGKVKVDGLVAGLGTKVFSGQKVEVEDQSLTRNNKMILLAFHKPAGIECTAAKDNPDNIIDYINYPERIFTVGRLDKNSTGLILLTNAGELANAIAKSVNNHEKEYLVKVDKPINADFIYKMHSGIYLEELNVKTKKCKVTMTGPKSFRIILTQGLNRQIRRMCLALGYKVEELHRVRVMNILLGDLKEGRYRHVTDKELEQLMADVNGR